MAKSIYITGGARSGKSAYAQQRALAQSISPIYLATAQVWDEDFSQRIQRHRNDRDGRWRTIEQQTQLSTVSLSKETVVIDCVTLWLTNLFQQEKQDTEKCLRIFREDLDALLKTDNTFFIISNEIGMGLHPHTEVGRKFTDLQGWANQYLAKQADETIFMISGLPMRVNSV